MHGQKQKQKFRFEGKQRFAIWNAAFQGNEKNCLAIPKLDYCEADQIKPNWY
jgi:hypothetical protein